MLLRVSIHAPQAGSDLRRGQPVDRRLGFNPRSPGGERLRSPRQATDSCWFQSTLPRRGATTLGRGQYRCPNAFQSTLPRRGATWRTTGVRTSVANCFNPRSPGGERPVLPAVVDNDRLVSIHAPQAGSDDPGVRVGVEQWVFQSTLPRRGATKGSAGFCLNCGPFQSTLPRRGATVWTISDAAALACFNPRSPGGERRANEVYGYSSHQVSIHAPQAGSDDNVELPQMGDTWFQSTLPRRGATAICRSSRSGFGVSIHAPQAGSDSRFRTAAYLTGFNPRSPGGERRWASMSSPNRHVSIHAPQAGSDAGTAVASCISGLRCFNPRSPGGERPQNMAVLYRPSPRYRPFQPRNIQVFVAKCLIFNF